MKLGIEYTKTNILKKKIMQNAENKAGGLVPDLFLFFFLKKLKMR